MSEQSDILSPEPGADLSADLDRLLSPALREGLAAVAAISERTGMTACLVGGPVRDLLLDREIIDLDVVVEGDGIAFAQELAGWKDREMVPFSRFGTAFVVLPSGVRVDVATARRESYPEAGNLPLVEPAALEEDLLRRDFTINAMAIRLGPTGRGEFIDRHRGREDLRSGLLRVLHDGSLRDDPTRILRAVRFRSRLRFDFAEETAALLERSVAEGLLERVSRKRLREELVAIMSEEAAAEALAYCSRSGIWSALFKLDIKIPEDLDQRFRAGDQAIAWYRSLEGKEERATVEPWVIRWLLIGAEGSGGDLAAIGRRWHLGQTAGRSADDIAGSYHHARATLEADSDPPASALYRALEGLQPETIVLLAAVCGERGRRRLAWYLTELTLIESLIDGRDLKELGLEEGPRIGQVLAEVLAARLDGEVRDREEALEMARRLSTGGKGH